MSLLVAENLVVNYDSHMVLQDLSIQIEAGRVLAILGPPNMNSPFYYLIKIKQNYEISR